MTTTGVEQIESRLHVIANLNSVVAELNLRCVAREQDYGTLARCVVAGIHMPLIGFLHRLDSAPPIP